LIADFYQALNSIHDLDLAKTNLTVYAKVPSSYISLYYYLGYCYLMLRRFSDAIKSFSKILLHFSRSEYQNNRFNQLDISKKIDQMYALLGIAFVFNPQPIDEIVYTTMKEKFAERIARASKGDESAYEDSFSYGSPKFISPAIPNYDDPSTSHNHNNIILNQQMRLFMSEVQQQEFVPKIRSYLKLYTSIPISKLSSFLAIPENQLISKLLAIKHKTNSAQWANGAPLSGKKSCSSDIEFYVDNDMICITDTKYTGNSAKLFLSFIDKYEDIISSLETSDS